MPRISLTRGRRGMQAATARRPPALPQPVRVVLPQLDPLRATEEGRWTSVSPALAPEVRWSERHSVFNRIKLAANLDRSDAFTARALARWVSRATALPPAAATRGRV